MKLSTVTVATLIGLCPFSLHTAKSDEPTASSWPGMDVSGTVTRVAPGERLRFETPSLPAGSYSFELTGTGDANLYVSAGVAPSTTAFDCRPLLSGSNERCQITLSNTLPVHLMVRGGSANSSDFRLVGRTDLPGACDSSANDSMVRVESGGRRWCVDRYEAVVCDSRLESSPARFRDSCVSIRNGNNSTRESLNPKPKDGDGSGCGAHEDCDSILPQIVSHEGEFTRPEFRSFRAYSMKGIMATRLVNFNQARALCHSAGKILIPNTVWTDAAEGTPESGANNGSFNTRCNTVGGARVGGKAGRSFDGIRNCISTWGVEEMIGNFWEISEAASSVARFRGGSSTWGADSHTSTDLIAKPLDMASLVSFRCAKEIPEGN